MKNIILFIFCTVLCFTRAYSNYSFQLKGSGFQAFNNKLIYLTFTEIDDGAYKKHTDSVLVRNGSFAFEGFIHNPACNAELSVRKANQHYFFILDSGELQVKPQSNIKLSQLVIPNSNTNRLRHAINRLESQLILNGKPIKGKSFRDVMLMELEMIRNEPKNFYSLIALEYLENRNRFIKGEEIAEAYSLLDETLRESALGTYLQDRINQAMALHPGKLFPDFEFMDLDDQMQNRDTLKSKTYLIAFGATWCGPCQKGMPELVAIQKNMDTSKFQIVYINMDNKKENWLRMIEKQGMQSFMNLTDTVSSSSLSRMKENFSLKGIPFYLIIDRYKIIQYNSYLVTDWDHKIRNRVIKEVVEADEKQGGLSK